MLSINLNQGEEILFIIRRHALSFCGTLFRFLIILSVVSSGYFFFPGNNWRMELIGGLGGLILLLLLCKFIFWHFTEMVITNQRIIDIDQQSLRKKKITEVFLEDILEVTYYKERGIRKFFNVGVLVITVEEGGKIVFFDAKKPNWLVEKINQIRPENERT